MIIFTFVMAGLLGLGCLIFAITEYFSWGNISKIALLIFLICLISVVGTVIHVSNISDKTTWEETWKTNIVAMKDNSDIEGRLGGGIFVVSGYINESPYYYCMESTSEGKHMIKIPADVTYIIETNDIQPSIVKKSERHIDKRFDFWFISSTNVKYTIYVPVGTVDTTYKIDLE